MKKLAERQEGDDENIAFGVDLGNALSAPGEDVVPTFTTCNDRLLILLQDGRRGMLRIEDAERLQGLPPSWTAPCYPLATPGGGAPRGIRPGNVAETEAHCTRRFELLGNAVTGAVARWLGERLANPYSYKYHGIGIHDRRMDDLLKVSGINTAGGGAAGAGTSRSVPAGPAGPAGAGASVPNIWSFVCADELQEAVLFPYIVKEDEKEEEKDAGNNNNGDGARGSGAAAAERNKNKKQQKEKEDAMIPDGDDLNAEEDPEAAARLVAEEVAGAAAAPAPVSSPVGVTTSASQDNNQAVDKAGEETITITTDSDDKPSEPTPEELFQAAMLARTTKKKKNATATTTTNSKRMQTPWDRDSWPRCAWWVRGIGSFAVQGMSEAPVLVPFQPLGEFITQLGREPTEEEISVYINRFQERGWVLSPVLRARLGGYPVNSPPDALLLGNEDNKNTGGGSGGGGDLAGGGGLGNRTTSAAAEIAQISRLPGLVSDADMIGDIVWAKDEISGIYWPAEIIDPLAPAAGKVLPLSAINLLTPEQKRASLPCTDGSYDPLQESAANRRVLAVYLPLPARGFSGVFHAWCNPGDVEPWEAPFLTQREKEANAAMKDPKFKYKDRLKWAIQDAKTSVALKTGRGGDRVEVEKMRRTRAAAAAAGVDLKRRCGYCKTCVSPISGTRRYDCLVQRMKAAALSGHAGAQVAVCGLEAVGARIALWWDGNQTFFNGTVCWWDPVTTEHTIAYEDGELGLHRLWQHDERIQILSAPQEWPAAAQDARARLRAAHEKLAASKLLKDERKAAAAAAGVAAEDEARARGEGGDEGEEAGKMEKIVQTNKEMLNMVAGATGGGASGSGAVPGGSPSPDKAGGRGDLVQSPQDGTTPGGTSGRGRGRGRGPGRGRGGRGPSSSGGRGASVSTGRGRGRGRSGHSSVTAPAATEAAGGSGSAGAGGSGTISGKKRGPEPGSGSKQGKSGGEVKEGGKKPRVSDGKEDTEIQID